MSRDTTVAFCKLIQFVISYILIFLSRKERPVAFQPERLRKARLQRGYTQKKLAAALNITQQSIGKYETDLGQPSAEILAQICIVLDISADYLLNLIELPLPLSRREEEQIALWRQSQLPDPVSASLAAIDNVRNDKPLPGERETGKNSLIPDR